MVGTCEYSNDPWASAGGRVFFDKLINCQLFNNELAPYRLRNRRATTSMPSPTYVIHNGVCFRPIFKITCTSVFRCICEVAKRDYKLGRGMSVRLSVRLPVRNISASTRWIVSFFIFEYFFENLSRKFKFH